MTFRRQTLSPRGGRSGPPLTIPVFPPESAAPRPLWKLLFGAAATLVALGSLELLGRLGLRFPSPTPPLLVVVGGVAAFAGLTQGLVSAGLALLYGLWVLRGAGGDAAFAELLVLQLTVPSMVLLAGLARRRLVSAARESRDVAQKRLRVLFENSRHAVSLVDETGTVLSASRSTAALLGLPIEVHVGRKARDVVHADDRPAFDAFLARALAEPGVPVTAEFRARHATAGWKPLEGVAVNHLDDPSIGALVVTTRDVSERTRAESALRLSEARYRSLFERNLAAVYLTTFPGGRIVAANEALARLLGYASPRELVGRDDVELHVDRDAHRRGYRELERSRALPSFEIPLRRKDGRSVWVLGNASLVDGDGADATLVEGTLVDITAIHEAQEKARRLDRMKTNFLIVASHELRTPLSVLTGFVEMLADGELGPVTERQAHTLAVCRRNLARMAATVGDVADVLQSEEGRGELRETGVDLAALVSEAADEVRAFVAERRQTLSLSLADGLAPIRADAEKLRAAFLAVLLNAVKFTPDGGTIAVRLEGDDASRRVEVEDSGIGIEPGELPLVFEKFYAGAEAAHHSSGRYQFKSRGAGLGLAIAKGHVEAHGGTLVAASAGAGRGATFRFVLPARTSAP